MTGAMLASAPRAIVVTSSTPLWYITRATGLVALVLLTAGMSLGLLTSVRFEGVRWPRFVTIGLHRNLALLACAFTALHVLTTVTDSFVPIGLADAFIPFISPYRPFWLGLGAIASDLMIALALTSLLRARLSYRTWRLVHWTSYACWPVAVLHGLGTGHDTPVTWVLWLTIGCVAVVAGLLSWRLAQGWQEAPGKRLTAAVALAAVLIISAVWLVSGPLQPGWARRAGTPAHASTRARAAASTPAPARRSGPAKAGDPEPTENNE